MGITPNDIAAQRAMLKRGEEKRKADWKRAERERLRDTFAAAALTGLLSNIPRYQLGVIAVQAYEIADEMIAEQSRAGKNLSETVPEVSKCTERENDHDAVPEARARDADRGRTDKAVTRPGEGTGNTPSEAEIDALEFVVEEGRTASVDDYGVLRSWLIRLRPEWESQSYEESDEKRVNNSTHRGIDRAAYDGDIVPRLKNWRGLHLAHGGELFEEAAGEIDRLREAIRRLAGQDGTLSVQGGSVTVTIDATITAEEREAVDTAEASLMRESTDLNAPLPVRQRLGAAAAILRGLLERLGGER